MASLAGSRIYPVETLNPVLRLWKPLMQTEVDKSWEIKDTTIANVPVLIYRPEYVNEGKKTTGVVYIHGGGWTFGSPGKFQYLMTFEFQMYPILVLCMPQKTFWFL